MSKFKLSGPVTIGDLVIIPGEPPAGFQPERGKRYFQLDINDPLFATFARQAEAGGFTEIEFHNGLALYAGGLEKAAAAGVTGDFGAVHSRLNDLIGADGMAIGNAATAEQLGALDVVTAHLVKQQAAASPASTADGGGNDLAESELKAIQASPAYLAEQSADAPLHRKVAAGWAKLYPPGSEPADHYLNPTSTPRAEPPPPADAVDPLTKAQLAVRVADRRYMTDPTFRAETEAAFKSAYPDSTPIGFGAGNSGGDGKSQ